MSRPALVLVLLAGAALFAAGCRRAPAPPADNEAAIRKRLGQKSTAVLLDEVAKTDFKPPADGHLTDPEIRSYLQVEERSRKIRAVAAQGAAPEQGATAELRSAQELGLNPKEMAWVHDRVREARSARLGDLLDRRLAESRRQLLQRWQDEEQRATDPAQKREIKRRIADFAQAPQSTGPTGQPWVHFNAELLARYETRVAGQAP